MDTIVIILIVIFIVLILAGVFAVIIYFVERDSESSEDKKVEDKDNEILKSDFSFAPTSQPTHYANNKVQTNGSFLEMKPSTSQCSKIKWKYGTFTDTDNASDPIENAIIWESDPTKILCHFNITNPNAPPGDGLNSDDFILVDNPFKPVTPLPTGITSIPKVNCQWVRNQGGLKTWCLSSDNNLCMISGQDAGGHIVKLINVSKDDSAGNDIQFDLSAPITPPGCTA